MELHTLDTRLREVEQEQAEARGKLDTLLTEVIKVRDSLEGVQKTAGKVDQIDRVEATALSAHKRVDKLTTDLDRLKWSHEYCQKDKADTSQLLKDINSQLHTLEGDVKAVKSNIASHTRNDDTTKSWWRARVDKLVDAALMILATVLCLAVLNHYAKQLPNKDLDEAQKKIDMLQQQLDAGGSRGATNNH